MLDGDESRIEQMGHLPGPDLFDLGEELPKTSISIHGY